MNKDILGLHELLDVDNPVDLGPATSPWTLEALRKVGWEKGDKIPGGCPAFFGAVFQQLQLRPIPESVLDALEDPDVLFVFQSAVRVVQERQHVQDTVEARLPEMYDPSVASTPAVQAIRAAAIEAETQKVLKTTPEEDLSDLMEDASPEPETAPKVSAITHCPCCRWDISQNYNAPDVSTEELQSYLIYVMGGPTYTKTYKLWGGLGTVTFAATTGTDEDLFLEQLSRDYALGRAELPAVEARRCDRYRVALALKSISFSTGESSKHIQAPGVWAPEYAPDSSESRLERYINNWYAKHVPSTELHTMLVVLWQEFNRRLGQLRQEMYRPDFWKGASLG